jgi:hypothetical protein
LQAHEALQPQLRLGVGETFAMLNLLTVGVTHEIVVEHHIAEPRQHDAARLLGIFRALERLLRALLHLLPRFVVSSAEEAAVLPMTVGRQHRGMLPTAATLRPIEVPRHVVTRIAREEHVLDRVALAIDLAVDHRVERRLLRQRPQAFGDLHLLPQRRAAGEPGVFRGVVRGEGVGMIEIPRRLQPRVLEGRR